MKEHLLHCFTPVHQHKCHTVAHLMDTNTVYHTVQAATNWFNLWNRLRLLGPYSRRGQYQQMHQHCSHDDLTIHATDMQYHHVWLWTAENCVTHLDSSCLTLKVKSTCTWNAGIPYPTWQPAAVLSHGSEHVNLHRAHKYAHTLAPMVNMPKAHSDAQHISDTVQSACHHTASPMLHATIVFTTSSVGFGCPTRTYGHGKRMGIILLTCVNTPLQLSPDIPGVY